VSAPAGRDRTRVGDRGHNVSFYFNPGRPSGNVTEVMYDSFMEKETRALWAQLEKAEGTEEFTLLCERFMALTEGTEGGREGVGVTPPLRVPRFDDFLI
jgi:hypothetical protein